MRKRKGDDRLAEGLDIEGLVTAGTEAAFEALGPAEFVSPRCVRCGSPLSYVVLTSKGPMGGDCYATLTGDDTTRKAWRSVMQSYDKHLIYSEPHQRIHTIQVRHDVRHSVLRGLRYDARYWYLDTIDDNPGLAEAIAASIADEHGLKLIIGEVAEDRGYHY